MPEFGGARLLRLYEAGEIKAEVGENRCWRIQCNRCYTWINSSITERTQLLSAGHFFGLEAHQAGTKCMYSPKYTRGASAPPDPQTGPTMDVDDESDDDDIQFQYGQSSSCPPEDTSARQHLPHPPNPPPISASPPVQNIPSIRCTGVRVDWDIEAGPVGSTFPWHRVFDKGEADARTEFFRVEFTTGGEIRAVSKQCSGTLAGDTCCSQCKKTPARILELRDLATNAKPHTNYRFLNYQQLAQLVTDKDSELRKLRTHVCCSKNIFSARHQNLFQCANLARRLGNTIKKLATPFKYAFAERGSQATPELPHVAMFRLCAPFVLPPSQPARKVARSRLNGVITWRSTWRRHIRNMCHPEIH
ncbi:hypothetical protein K438DRAFT_1830440 [Mycena galopus ATCC 62051]|nr:hypothetical protein K438DRAFT_1830440 [Mycena galopus ATCC 62051]